MFRWITGKLVCWWCGSLRGSCPRYAECCRREQQEYQRSLAAVDEMSDSCDWEDGVPF